MDEPALLRLLTDVRSGACTPDEAVYRLRRLPFADLGFAKVDHHRGLRQGLPEAVYGQGKTPEQCAAIVGELLHGSPAETSVTPRGTVLLLGARTTVPVRRDPTADPTTAPR